MKKVLTVTLALLLITSALSGCHKTPDSPIVVGKDNNEMIEKAKQTPQNDVSLTTSHYKTEFTGAKDKLTVSVDADVVVPKEGDIPILKVKRSSFSQEQATKIISALVKGKLLQCGEEFVYSKDAVEKHILYLKSLGRQDDDYMKKEIAYCERLLQEMPESPQPISGLFETGTKMQMDAEKVYSVEDKDTMYIRGMSVGKGCYETLNIVDGNEMPSSVVYVREPVASATISADMFRYITKEEAYDPVRDAADTNKKETAFLTLDQVNQIADISTTEEQAQAVADTLMEQLGIDYADCIIAEKVYGGSYDNIQGTYGKANPLRCVWRLRYGREAGGLVTTHTADKGANLGEDTTSKSWVYEAITVYIDDSGIVGFSWWSPYEILKTEVDNASVLSFEDIKGIFEKMMPIKYSYYGDFENTKIKMVITEIRFGLARVSAPNDRDIGFLIPVWDFFGYAEFQEAGKNPQRSEELYQSYLTINAVDGTLIDRALGY